METAVRPVAPEERPLLANLVKMCCYEWSQYNAFDVDEQGVYPFEAYVRFYFERPRRWAYLLRVDGKPAGFALIDDDFAFSPDSDHSMGEFFVMHKYRRHGAGARMARTLFDLHPGKWEVGFHPLNAPSAAFWPRVVDAYTSGRFALHEACPGLAYHDGTLGSVLTFDNAR